MVRMTDILKKIKSKEGKRGPQEEKPPVAPSPAKSEPVVSKQDPKKEKMPQQRMSDVFKSIKDIVSKKEDKKQKEEVPRSKPPKAADVRISRMIRETEVSPDKKTLKLYEDALSLIDKLMNQERLDDKSIDLKELSVMAERIINQIKEADDELLNLALVTNPKQDTPSTYLLHHLVNSAIFSILIGVTLEFNNEKLINLGISAFLYDIYMLKYIDTAEKAESLSVDEFNQIKKHTVEGAEFLKTIKELPPGVPKAAQQHHERLDGSGYPQGIKEENIEESAKIIGFADVYEALTHRRAYREAYNHFDAMKIILKRKGDFDYRIVKAFLSKMGMYPVGTIVELNTKETAKVIKHNPKQPLAPKVMVLSDPQAQGEEGSRIIDLSKEATIYIARCFSCERISKEAGKKQ